MTDFIHPEVAKQYAAMVETHRRHNHTFPLIGERLPAIQCECGALWVILRRRGEEGKVLVCEKCGDWHSILFK